MGITGLSKKINAFSNIVNISKFKGQTLAIDTSIFLYSFLRQPRKNALISGFVNQVAMFCRNEITPIYVFDGKPLKEKLVIDKRKKVKSKNTQKFNDIHNDLSTKLNIFSEKNGIDLGKRNNGDDSNLAESTIDYETIKMNVLENIECDKEAQYLVAQIVDLQDQHQSLYKAHTNIRYPTNKDKQQCKTLFDLCGIPYIQAPNETDALCAHLSKMGLIDGVVSTDTDFLPYGCTRLLSGLRNDTGECKEYVLQNILAGLDMTRNQFIDMCILCGCDYADKINKIAVIGAYKFVKEHETIENVLQLIDASEKLQKKHEYPENFLSQVNTARDLFNLEHLLIKEQPIIDKELLVKGNIQFEELQIFLNNNYYNTFNINLFKPPSVDTTINNDQGKITSFFMTKNTF